MIIQFATYTPGYSQLDFSFPIAFSNTCIAVCVTNRWHSMTYVSGYEVYNITSTTFNYDSYRGSNDKIQFSMIAIGY